MTVEYVTRCPNTALTSHFVTARAAARHMVEQGSGVILSVTSGTTRFPSAGMGNTGPADAALELFMRTLSAEIGPRVVRVVGIYTAAVAETLRRERLAEVSGRTWTPRRS